MSRSSNVFNIPLTRSVMDYLSQVKADAKSGRFILLEKEIPLHGYATFTGLQLMIGKEPMFTECTVSFTNQRLLMTRKLSPSSNGEIVGWALDRQFIHAIKDCAGGLFKSSKRVRLVIKDPRLKHPTEEDYFELKFPEEDFSELKQSFLNVLKIVDLCQACDEDRLEDFQILLQSNPTLVNIPIDSKKNTLFIMACARNKAAFARYLLQFRDLDINKTTTVQVMRDGRLGLDIYGALYYACINNMEEVVHDLLLIPTVDLNILYTDEYTALQYALRKDIECQSAFASNPNSRRISYAKIISMLMSSRKTNWKIGENKIFAIPESWILSATSDTQKAILLCSRVNELPADLKQKLATSIQEKQRKTQSYKSLNGQVVRLDSSSTIATEDIESCSKICKSDSFQSLYSKVVSSPSANFVNPIDPIAQEINQCRAFFDRLELTPTLQLSFAKLKVLKVCDDIAIAKSSKSHRTTAQLAKQKKQWKIWIDEISVSIEKQLPEALDGEDFESIKVFLLQEIEKLFEYYVDTEADAKVFEELDELKEQVESLVLSPKENQSEVSKVSAGPTASAPVYPPIPLPTNKTSHVFISHAWAEDEEGRDNHLRVKYLNDILKKRGIVTWFDDDRIGLDMSTFRTTLAKALYSTCCVLICITKQYEVKVNGGDESDSCHYEFNVVANCKLASARMTAVMERSMLHTGSWEEGRLKAELGPKLFSDLSSDINFEENCEVIVKNIVKMLQSS